MDSAGSGEPPNSPPIVSQPTLREIHKTVWNIAWPSVTTMLLHTINGLMDVAFVGHLEHSASALSATGVGGSVIFLLISLSMAVSVGTTALVARFTGAKQSQNATLATSQSVVLSLLLGIVFGVTFYLLRMPISRMLLDANSSPEAARLCAEFLEIALFSAVPIFVMGALSGVFRGLGDTRTPLYITIVTVAVHIGLNFVLIYGRFGIPGMGVRGAAVSLTISIFVSLLLHALALRSRTELSKALNFSALRYNQEWAIRILRIGFPASLQALIRQLGMVSFVSMLSRTVEGEAGVAALQIGLRAEAIAFMPGFAYGVAASALVGQSLGAKDPDLAERYGWAANLQGMIVMTVMAVIFFCGSGYAPTLFTQDPQVQRLASDYLRISSICEPFLALAMVLTGALQGAGDTWRPTLITFFTMWVIRMPLGWLLIFKLNMQTMGAWWVMSLTTIVGGLITMMLFRAGYWKRSKV